MSRFKNDIEFAKFIKSLGGHAYLVGGAVRDKLMDRPIHDKDYVITGFNKNTIPFKKYVGKDFGVYLVNIAGTDCEVALARLDKKIGNGHKGFRIDCVSNISIEEDLKRRDLTINAIAIDILSNEIIDPFNGRGDIIKKELKPVSSYFKEDPLRVYRVARFAACLKGFKISIDTSQIMFKMKGVLKYLPVERVWKELEKALLGTEPSMFFRTLKGCNLLDVHFKEVDSLNVSDMHDGTAFNHTMKCIDNWSNSVELEIVFGLLVHDFGKGITPKDMHPKHHGHDKLGMQEVEIFCNRLKVPTRIKKIGILASDTHMKIKCIPNMRKGKVFKFITNTPHFETLFNISMIDTLSRDTYNSLDDDKENKIYSIIFNYVEVANRAKKDITSKQLKEEGYKPSRAFGELLEQRRIRYFIGNINPQEKDYE